MGTLVFQATLGGAVNIIGPNIANTINFTLPSADGTSGQTWTTNGSGVLSFGTLGIAGGGTGQITATAAFNALAPSQSGQSGKYLTTDGTNTSWGTNPLGTVTSVAATVPSFLSIAGSPITTSGTLAFTLSGTALPTTSGGTGLTSFTSGGVVYASSSSVLATGSVLVFNGTNLGVGITPSANQFGNNLQVNQTILNDDGAGTNHLSKNAYYNSGWKYITTDYASKYTQALGVHSWYTAASGTAGNAISFTQAMTLDASGNLLVGTTTALARITTSRSAGSAGQVNGQISMTHDGATTGYYISTIRGASTNEPEGLTFKENATERMRIDSAGNVGIGTSSPAYRLQVKDGSVGVTSGDGTVTTTINYNSIGTVTNSAFNIFTNSTDRLVVSATGNLGLGVTPNTWGSSSKAIEFGSYGAVSSNGSSGGAYLSNNACMSTNTDTSGWVYKVTDAGATLYKQGLGSHAWYRAGSGSQGASVSFTQAMTLTAAGNLGIGTTSPAAKLDVNGQINTTNIVAGIRSNITSTDRISVTGATTIFSIATSGSSVGASSAFLLVNGYDTGTTTNSFTDLVLFIGGQTPVVVSTVNRGVPAVRVYTASGGTALQLAMASGTYNVANSTIEQAC